MLKKKVVEEYRKENNRALFFGEKKLIGTKGNNSLISKDEWEKQCLLDYLLLNEFILVFTENDVIKGNVKKPSYLPIDVNRWNSLFLEISQQILNVVFSTRTNNEYIIEALNYRNLQDRYEMYSKIIKNMF